ncbi:Cerebral protein, putative [Entamoeba dispar SAW760]|uniref:Ribosomal RNA-processing protein 8 n=1 Tax=Entamoeba dispar (strain ATCC PRA-260 / SAW760) TaxID=370354 RepID=B0EMW7_ENTDS|nr:Cerebral protein, putative [Entamoeba dispar SAW760]XP_001739527.1 Cerebral protein, putative [Entamoeba dispar SAW760]EDR24091.1 Cerebral protein, putative [Entamoeba dispar SAW760]EDR24128.1 Cerebral protein, putative [Entamoeba dispar SAW760]|eukprot:EDR24091.1 Cerebral protein, putative [Entamoeba dispar SAW760]
MEGKRKKKTLTEGNQSRILKTKEERKPKKNGGKKQGTLIESFANDLEGSKFRYINEILYTSRGDQAKHLFEEKPELFEEYHQGYAKQVEHWPINPLDGIIEYIKKNNQIQHIVDMGCGEARLSLECKDRIVESFDLYKANERVKVANITKVPIQKGWSDAVVFCLSLMGTDFHLFLKEGFRILKPNGLMIIAEPISRLKSIKGFINGIEQLGFVTIKEDENNVFVMLVFRKNAKNYVLNQNQMEKLKKKVHLSPCLYKKR